MHTISDIIVVLVQISHSFTEVSEAETAISKYRKQGAMPIKHSRFMMCERLCGRCSNVLLLVEQL